jgi:hypothetical protein
MRLKLDPKRVVTDPANHPHRVAQARDGHGLVRALASGMRGKVVAEKGLSGSRNPRSPCDEIDVDASHYDDGSLCAQRCVSLVVIMLIGFA